MKNFRVFFVTEAVVYEKLPVGVAGDGNDTKGTH